MFNFNLFFLLISFLFLITCSYLDLKYREISNKVTLLFLATAIIFKILQSIFLNNIFYLLNSLFAFIIAFFVFFVIWSLGVLAGGDLKIFLVLALLNPFSISYFYSSNFTLPIFVLILFVFSLFCILPYTLIISIFKTYKYKRKLKKVFTKENGKNLFSSAILLYIIYFIFSFFYNIDLYLVFILSFLFVLLYSKLKKIYSNKANNILFIVFVIIIVYNLLYGNTQNIRSFINILIFLLFFKLIFNLVSVLSSNLIVLKKVENLKEGDIPYYNYYYKNGKVKIKKYNIKDVFILFLKNKYYKNLKIDSNKAGGLNNKDIKFLNTLYKNNLIDKKIILKDSLPFVPAILLAYILMIFIGEKIV